MKNHRLRTGFRRDQRACHEYHTAHEAGDAVDDTSASIHIHSSAISTTNF